MSNPTPTQVRRPWRATVRTVFAGIVAFAALLPFIVEATRLEPEVYPWLAGALAIAGAVTRVMALPQVEVFLRRFLPFLAAEPKRAEEGEHGSVSLVTVLLIVVLVVVLLMLLGVFH